MTNDQDIIASFDDHKTYVPIVLQSDAEKDQELITSGVRDVARQVHHGRENLTCEYTPGKDFTGSFVLEVQVDAESVGEALTGLARELVVLISRLSRSGVVLGKPERLLLEVAANPIGAK